MRNKKNKIGFSSHLPRPQTQGRQTKKIDSVLLSVTFRKSAHLLHKRPDLYTPHKWVTVFLIKTQFSEIFGKNDPHIRILAAFPAKNGVNIVAKITSI